MSKECTVCFQEKQVDAFESPTARCKHSNICKICIQSHINTHRLKQREIPCPDKNCTNMFNDLGDFRKFVPAKTIEEIEYSWLRKYLESDEEFRWCCTAGCGSGQLVEGGSGANNFWKCTKCNKLNCIIHKIQMHCGMTCAEYDLMVSNNPDLADEHYLLKNTKNCPGCGVNIEKNEGCDHMTCKKCQFEFCWLCLANYAPIRKNGNHRHKPSCAHYFAGSEL